MSALYFAASVQIDDHICGNGVMLVGCPTREISIQARNNNHVMVIGGDPVGERHIWWNFASSSKQRIEKTKSDRNAGRFELVPDDTKFIPFPEE
jgi:redox-sensitive bicupin YhaK (pirin superfamily)